MDKMLMKPGQILWCDDPTNAFEDIGFSEREAACLAAEVDAEVDPDGKEQHELGAKLDADKPDTSLLLMFGKALEAVAQVGTLGARKYTRGGWQSVARGRERYTAALMRHLFKEHYEDNDPDLGVLHSAQVAWNALARLELDLREREVLPAAAFGSLSLKDIKEAVKKVMERDDADAKQS